VKPEGEMPEHDLLLHINENVGAILSELGGIRADLRNQNTRIDGIEKDNETRDQKIEDLSRFAATIIQERKFIMWTAGGVSAVVYLTLAVLTYIFRR